MTKHFILCAALAMSACGSDTTTETEIEVLGIWNTNFGTTETVTAALWGTQTIEKFDNEANFAVAKNPADDKYFPSKYSKHVWTEPEASSFFYCTVDYGRETLAQAETTTQTADRSKVGTDADKGCGGYPWTKMVKK